MAARVRRLCDVPEDMRAAVIAVCEATVAMQRGPGWRPCVRDGHACFKCQERAADKMKDPNQ